MVDMTCEMPNILTALMLLRRVEVTLSRSCTFSIHCRCAELALAETLDVAAMNTGR